MKRCKHCNKPLPKPDNPNIRNYKYCNKKCRGKFYYKKIGGKHYQRKQTQKKLKKKYGKENLKTCLICDKQFIQVGSHVQAVHKMSAREYREEFDLPLKKGITPGWYEKEKGEIALDNGTYKNLEKGKKYRFEKGDERAKVNTGWKGRAGNKGYESDAYY